MDLFDVLASERLRLADELDELGPDEWAAPSRCAGWSNHVVVAHLTMPWSVRPASFAIEVVRARGNIDRAMDRAARRTAEGLDPPGCVRDLRDNATSRRTPPGFGVEAPLTDLLVHADDVLRPLGRAHDADPEALRCSLAFMGTKGAARGFGARSLGGLRLEATDVDASVGTGAAVIQGPALSLCGAILGRDDVLDDLVGDGVAVLAARR